MNKWMNKWSTPVTKRNWYRNERKIELWNRRKYKHIMKKKDQVNERKSEGIKEITTLRITKMQAT